MNVVDLDLNLLRVFHALSEERSVTRTADRLSLSQPAVSNALRRLRDFLGDDLYVRGQGGMVPTPRAEALEPRVASALHAIDAAVIGGPEVYPERITEPILIICADEEILLHGADILAAISASGCSAPVQFVPLNLDYRSDMLWRNRLAVTVTTMLYAPDGLVQRKVYDEHLVVLARADHPAAQDMSLDAYLAAEHLLIAPFGGRPSGFLDKWLHARGRARTIRLISHSFGSAHTLVRDTGLLATLPSYQAARRIYGDTLTVKALPIPTQSFGLHVFWSERYDKDPLNHWLRDTVHKAMLGGLKPSGAQSAV